MYPYYIPSYSESQEFFSNFLRKTVDFQKDSWYILSIRRIPMEDDKLFAKNLKAIRVAANVSIAELSGYLTSLGYKASEKTIYSWESGNSQPTPSALLDLCRFCAVDDVLAAFGYNHEQNKDDARLIKNFHALNEEGQEKLLDYSDDLVDTGKYKKHGKVILGSKEA